jgi:hypothetical protein
MHTVLDLDLDFFVWPIKHWRVGRRPLAAHEYEHLATDREVRGFLEQHCHLNKSEKIPGQVFVEHQDAFRVWRRWIKDGILTSPFRVFHVDAHSDLGLAGWAYLSTKLLARPLQQRSRPRFARDYLNSGNYLTFAIANRWISSLTYVFPTGPSSAAGLAGRSCPDDLPKVHFWKDDWKAGRIQLKRYHREDILAVATGSTRTPLDVEPCVPFNCVAASKFSFSGFTHFVVAQSPGYTPPTANKLLKIIREYTLSVPLVY